MLISQPERQCQRWRGLPGVLEKVRLPQLVRVEDTAASGSLNTSRLAAVIIQKVSEGGVTGRNTVDDLAQRKTSPSLRGQHAQQLGAVAQGVPPRELGLRLLEQEVVGEAELEGLIDAGRGGICNEDVRWRSEQPSR